LPLEFDLQNAPKFDKSDDISIQNIPCTADDLLNFKDFESIECECTVNLMAQPWSDQQNIMEDHFDSSASQQQSSEDNKPSPNYRGKRKNIGNGTNSQRFDVVYKTLLRSLRRHLWNVFINDHQIYQNERKISSEKYIENFEEFYFSYFKSQTKLANELTQEQEHMVKYALSLLMTTDYHIKRKDFIQRNLSNTINSCLRGFSTQKYKILFKNQGVSLLFGLIKETNIIDKMIEVYSHLEKTQDSYMKAVDRIINYRNDSILTL